MPKKGTSKGLGSEIPLKRITACHSGLGFKDELLQ